MPIKPGRGKKVRAENISEIMTSFKATGKIGNSEPRSTQAAAKQAAAIAYQAERKAMARLTDARRRARIKALK